MQPARPAKPSCKDGRPRTGRVSSTNRAYFDETGAYTIFVYAREVRLCYKASGGCATRGVARA